MKKFILATALVLGFAAAAIIAPGYEIKVVEKAASACGRSGVGC